MKRTVTILSQIRFAGGDTFLEFALKTSLISLADNMKQTVTFLSRNLLQTIMPLPH